MKRNGLLPALYISFFIAVIAGLVFYIVGLDKSIRSETIHKTGDTLFSKFRSELEEEKSEALAFALTLAQNQALAVALDNDDEEGGYTILSNFMQTLKKYTHYTVRTQIITGDFCIFARSWDNSFAGMPIDIYRPDLLLFHGNKQPKVALEVGRRLGIKATVPVIKEGEVLGFVEVLKFFEEITEKFQLQKIDLIFLMEESYLETATLMRANPSLGGYVVANLYVNQFHLDNLTPKDFDAIRKNGYTLLNNFYYFSEPMFDGRGEKIGIVLAAIQKNRLEAISKKEEYISFFLNMTRDDLYAIIKSKEEHANIYKSVYDQELLYLKDSVSAEDRPLFLKEAQERLNDYTKEELIDLILGHNFSKKIQGEIR